MTVGRRIAQSLKPFVYSPRFERLNALVERTVLRAYARSRYWRWYFANESKLATYGSQEIHADLRYRLYADLGAAEGLRDAPLDYLEFGVAAGDSIRWWSSYLTNPETRLVGFDLFTGLPEDWESLKAGAFSTNGKPPTLADPRCTFQKGLVQDTLPAFLRETASERRKVIHMDLDLYSGTLFALVHLAPVLRIGDLVLFDEFASYMHEFRAWNDFLASCSLKFEPLQGTNEFFQVAFKRTA
jgi:O-methyltransferase